MHIADQSYFSKPPQSYWMDSASNSDYPTLSENLNLDVAIVGGGITGILCAYWLNKQGVKTAIIEADRILQGTTGHTTAKITSQHGLIYSKIKKQIINLGIIKGGDWFTVSLRNNKPVPLWS